uniref:uncharacterized protein isoform X7 n=1 Tax=Pristiophorus japonicus TaxID=55135 RepID=UPI00398E6B54
MANICFMNRKMNTIDSKISALLKSQMMKWLEFRKLVTKVDRFFYDHKLCELMKKKHSRKVNVVDHKFDFYSILLELLYEVHRNDPYEQPKLFEKVLEWHHTNQVKLKLMGSASDYNSTVGKDSRLQPCDHICTDENAVCPSVTMVKSTESKQIKKPEIPENAARPKTFPGSRTLTEQYNPTDGKPIESFRSFCERNLHLQGSSQRKCPQNPFFKRKATLNLHDVLHATNAISAKIELTTRKKRAQSVPPYQSRAVSNVTEKNRQQTSVPHSAKGGKIYHDWRGLISQESSRIYSVAEVSSTPQRAWSQKKVLKRQKQSAPQGDGQKALDSILHQNDTAGQKGTVAGIPGINRWKNVAVESPENERQQQLYSKNLFTIYNRPINIEMKARQKQLLMEKIQREVERKIDIERYERHLQNYNAARTGRIQSSRPHTDIFDAIHTKKTGPTPYERKMATIFLQKFIRGWLVRVTCDRIKSKALEHGASLSAVVRQYRRMMSRLRKRFHAPQQSISLVWSELEDWLDQKKKYEDMFAKRQFWKEINVSELPTFFQDCDHYPSPREINQTWALINSGHFIKLPESLKKKQVIEMAFTIYPAEGARLGDQSIYRSTWVRPIVNGDEGHKYILSGHPILQKAKIQVVGDLVARSIFERNKNLTSIQKFSTAVEKAIDALTV